MYNLLRTLHLQKNCWLDNGFHILVQCQNISRIYLNQIGHFLHNYKCKYFPESKQSCNPTKREYAPHTTGELQIGTWLSAGEVIDTPTRVPTARLPHTEATSLANLQKLEKRHPAIKYMVIDLNKPRGHLFQTTRWIASYSDKRR